MFLLYSFSIVVVQCSDNFFVVVVCLFVCLFFTKSLKNIS